MRRLLRQHWAVLSVLRSCALVKLYKAVSCTSFWTSSRAALAAVSWSTCCCRRSRLGRHYCPLDLSLSSAGAACQVFGRLLYRVEPENSNECHGVMYFDIATCRLLTQRGQIEKRTEGEERGREKKPRQRQSKKPPTPPCPTHNSVRGGRAIQGHPLVASTASYLVYWNLSSSV